MTLQKWYLMETAVVLCTNPLIIVLNTKGTSTYSNYDYESDVAKMGS